jgi:hypothetical protein
VHRRAALSRRRDPTMRGIVGYIGTQEATAILLDGLRELE